MRKIPYALDTRILSVDIQSDLVELVLSASAPSRIVSGIQMYSLPDNQKV